MYRGSGSALFRDAFPGPHPITITKTIRGSIPAIPFETIAQRILSSSYELSLTICGDTLARRMNKAYRNKTYAPNVLSFPYGPHEGEIFLNPRKAAREASRFDRTYREHLAFLFIHGCLHLKGLDHGPAMEKEETALMRVFGFAR